MVIEQKQRQQDGAERIDMLQRVEGDPPLRIGRVVAAKPGDETVGGFMEGDGDQHRQGQDRQDQHGPAEIKAVHCRP